MGLLGNILKSAVGGNTTANADPNAISSIIDILNDDKVGGLDGITGKLTNSGLGNIVNSWISTGKNKSIKTNQVSNALGSDILEQLASKLGISKIAAAGMLAKYLPVIIDKLTPDGKASSPGKINVQDILGSILKK